MGKTFAKILFSKTRVGRYVTDTETHFNACVADLLASESVLRLDDFSQHLKTSRLIHSVNVAYYSFLICRKFGLNAYSAARAGLLHDLYHYDWRDEKKGEPHAFAHPKEALRNARAVTRVTPAEENAILAHMWPLSHDRPRTAVAAAVCAADKFCCVSEIIVAAYGFVKSELTRERRFPTFSWPGKRKYIEA